VIVDVNESVTIDPTAIEAAIGRARVPSFRCTCGHDVRHGCHHGDCAPRKLFVIEDCCQAVGGSYKGRKAGSIVMLAATASISTRT